MLSGDRLYRGENKDDLYRNILLTDLKFPEKWRLKVKDFLSKLLMMVPKMRISIHDALKHEVFMIKFNYEKLQANQQYSIKKNQEKIEIQIV